MFFSVILYLTTLLDLHLCECHPSNIQKGHQRNLKMLRTIYISMLCLLVANAQPLPCKEDVHCSEGYFCETQANVCQECLKCQDLKRLPPMLDVTNECIKTIHICGPCAEGFINIYGHGIKGKCVVPEFFEFGRRPHYAYVCLTAAVIGVLIVASFMYVIKHTDVFRVVAYYDIPIYFDDWKKAISPESDHPVSGSPPAAEAPVPNTTSPRHLFKYMLRFDKNPSNK